MTANANQCPTCRRPVGLCPCQAITPRRAAKKLLILQHPQEAKNIKGTAFLLPLAIPNSVLKVGLSWSSLSHALGGTADPKKWGVLYVGTQKQLPPKPTGKRLVPISGKKMATAAPQRSLEGVILLDGNWAQAKTLWWRNPWLLRLQRLMLYPDDMSKYGNFRQQPRSYCLSTLEAASLVLEELGGSEEATASLPALMDAFLEKARGFHPAGIEVARNRHE